jgi:hypothetical protein
MNRPTGITVIGILFIIFGSIAAIEMLGGLSGPNRTINIGALGIPIGIYLLKGSANARWWAKLCIVLGAIFFGALLLGYPFFGRSYNVTWLGRPAFGMTRHLVAIGLPLCFLLVYRLVWKYLTTPEADLFFAGDNTSNP